MSRSASGEAKSSLGSSQSDTIAYEKSRKTLKQLLDRRASFERELEDVEDRIYCEETSYLQDSIAGNIAKGFEHYTKSSQNRRRTTLSDADRVFSQSASSIFDE